MMLDLIKLSKNRDGNKIEIILIDKVQAYMILNFNFFFLSNEDDLLSFFFKLNNIYIFLINCKSKLIF